MPPLGTPAANADREADAAIAKEIAAADRAAETSGSGHP